VGKTSVSPHIMVPGVNSIELPLLCINVPNYTILHSRNQNLPLSYIFLQFEQIAETIDIRFDMRGPHVGMTWQGGHGAGRHSLPLLGRAHDL
jgi:hypothetical protein